MEWYYFLSQYITDTTVLVKQFVIKYYILECIISVKNNKFCPYNMKSNLDNL